jgi:hypothetical protein
MSQDKPVTTHCNARLKTRDEELDRAEPGEWAGEGYCKRPVSDGRCKDHGGNGGRPPKHGLYSDLRDDLQEYVDDALALDAPGDLQGELAVLRALVKRWLDNAGDLDRDAIEAAHKLLKEVRRTSDTIHQQMMRERLSKEEERQLVDTFAEIITEYVQPSVRDEALDALQRALDGRGRVRQIEGK